MYLLSVVMLLNESIIRIQTAKRKHSIDEAFEIENFWFNAFYQVTQNLVNANKLELNRPCLIVSIVLQGEI